MSRPSAFLHLVGESAKARVLDFLLTRPEADYSKTEVARKAGVSRVTIGPVWKELVQGKLILPTRSIANARLYALDLQHPQVAALIRFNSQLSASQTGKFNSRRDLPK